MREILRALWPYLRPHRRTMWLAVGSMVGAAATTVLAPWPLKFVFDRVLLVPHNGHTHVALTLGRSQWLLLAAIIAVAIVIATADALFKYFATQLSEVASQKAVFELRKALFAHLQRLSVDYHQSAQTRLGDLLSRMSGDIGALQDLAASGISNLVTNSLTLLVMAGLLVWLDWPMALAAIVVTLPTLLYARRTTTGMRQAMRAARRQEGQVAAVLQESLTNVKLVQAYGREEHEAGRLREASDRSLAANIRAATLLARLAPSVSLISTVGYSLLIALGVDQVVAGHLTAGELLVLFSYVRGTQSPIRQLAKMSYSVSKAGASLERIRDVLAVVPAINERPGASTLTIDAPPAVEFRNVAFGYTQGHPVLRGVSLAAGPGQLVALVGATGSGKSTLLSLLARFYDPWSGAVLIDRHDVRDLTLPSLRASVALVLQDSLIFRATLLENIAYGRPGADQAAIIAAAESAGVAAIAARLEDGYDTMVSERGASLSGGEKQCVGIARAILKQAPIVVLDEPTSAMDAHTEQLVMSGLERLLQGRTGFIIAHRLSTVMKADLVAVLDGGRLVESGKPLELLDNPRSRFSGLARAQLIPEAAASSRSPIDRWSRFVAAIGAQ